MCGEMKKYVRLFESRKFTSLVLSAKSADVVRTIEIQVHELAKWVRANLVVNQFLLIGNEGLEPHMCSHEEPVARARHQRNEIRAGSTVQVGGIIKVADVVLDCRADGRHQHEDSHVCEKGRGAQNS